MMLLFGQSKLAAFRPSPIDHPDMLMRIGDMMNIKETWSDKSPRAVTSGRRPFAKQFHIKPAFLPGLPQCRLFRIFIQFHMSADRQPLIQLPMMNDQNFALVNNEDRHREINFFVNVRHRA